MLQALIGPVTGLLDKFIEDKDQKNRLAHDIATMSEKHANALAKEQAKANTEAAKHPSMFVAGARPAIMWVCAIGLFVNFFILPILTWWMDMHSGNGVSFYYSTIPNIFFSFIWTQDGDTELPDGYTHDSFIWNVGSWVIEEF